MHINITSQKFDKPLLFMTIGLILIGIIMVFSSTVDRSFNKFDYSTFYFSKHIIRVFIGVLAMIFGMIIDYNYLKKIAGPFLIFSIFLLLLTKIIYLIENGINSDPARWLNIGIFTIQTSDIARLSVIIYLANYIDRKKDNIRDYIDGFLPPLLMVLIVMILIIIQPDFSTAAMIFFIFSIMIFIGRAKLIHLISTGLMGLIFLIPVMYFREYRVYRITSFFDGFFDLSKASHQLQQSFYSLGNGGINGVGLGSSSGKNLFLPEAHTDFILSIIGEEGGYISILIILTLYLSIFQRSIKISKSCTDTFGIMLSIGLSIQILSYAFLHAGVVTGLVPTTGIQIPLISFGGSGLIINLFSIGIILNISLNKKKIRRNRSFISA